jgi:hypothetical protein
MIPNIIHFIFGLKEDFGGKGFSFLHFLAVYTAWKVNKPEKMFFHYVFEPTGDWWAKAKPYLTLNKVNPPEEIFGNALAHFAHKSDVIRLDVLKKYGGIYLDMDVVCINPFRPLLEKKFVLGIEPGVGLCNAVILSEPNAEFLSLWYNEYKTFDGNLWSYHSVQLPWILANRYPSLIHIEGKDSFFYPMYNDPVHLYLWYPSVPSYRQVRSLMNSFISYIILLAKGEKNRIKKANCSLHGIFGKDWHYKKLCKSYCVHLVESLWWDRYLKPLSPSHILNDSSNFSLLIKSIAGKQELARFAE